MALSSMTGFSRSHGTSGLYTFEWELKSVNAKGLDLRVRLPQGWDDLEGTVRKRVGEAVSRGTVYANLNVKRAGSAAVARINEDVLASVLGAARGLASRAGALPPTVDGLLAVKGVIDIVEPESDEAEITAAKAAATASFEAALSGLVEMRDREGVSLGDILSQRVNDIERLAAKAEAIDAMGLEIAPQQHLGGRHRRPERTSPAPLAIADGSMRHGWLPSSPALPRKGGGRERIASAGDHGLDHADSPPASVGTSSGRKP